MLVYHGTNEQFSSSDINFKRSFEAFHGHSLGPGFYVTTDRNKALGYGKNILVYEFTPSKYQLCHERITFDRDKVALLLLLAQANDPTFITNWADSNQIEPYLQELVDEHLDLYSDIDIIASLNNIGVDQKVFEEFTHITQKGYVYNEEYNEYCVYDTSLLKPVESQTEKYIQQSYDAGLDIRYVDTFETFDDVVEIIKNACNKSPEEAKILAEDLLEDNMVYIEEEIEALHINHKNKIYAEYPPYIVALETQPIYDKNSQNYLFAFSETGENIDRAFDLETGSIGKLNLQEQTYQKISDIDKTDIELLKLSSKDIFVQESEDLLELNITRK